MRISYLAALAAFADLLSPCFAASSDSPKPHRPCTVRSPTTDRFFDLTPIWVVLPDKDAKKKTKTEHIEREESWHARGYDYGANFTVNFCGPVVEKLEDVVDVPESMWKNISAFYVKSGRTYSMGMQQSDPVFRGRKLVLNYTDGSYCDSSVTHNAASNVFGEEYKDVESLTSGGFKTYSSSDDEDWDHGKGKDKDKDKDKESNKGRRKKSTIISLLCETDPLAAKAALSFVAATEDECTYFFEARTHAACGTIEKEAQQLGPSGVFGVIFLIAILAYMVGGCVYQRTVMHQRGWRQLPNYGVWAGIAGFVRDFLIIITSSCGRLFPARRGYSRVSTNGYGRPRSNHSDDENRLIDQLDEEWDD